MKSLSVIFAILFVAQIAFANEKLTPIVENGNLGYINSIGETIIKPVYSPKIQYQNIQIDQETFRIPIFDKLNHFSDGLAVVEKKKTFLYIPIYKESYVIDDQGDVKIQDLNGFISKFSSGVAVFEDHNTQMYGDSKIKKSLIDINGKVVIDKKYDEIFDFCEGTALIFDNGKYSYINTKDEKIFQNSFVWASCFFEGLAPASEDGIKFGYIDKKGNWAIEPTYDKTFRFSDGIAKVVIEGKIAYINKENEFINDKLFDYGTNFSDGFAAVSFNGEPYFISKDGKKLNNSKFESIDVFSEGLAPVKVNGKWGFINNNNEFVIAPEYNLVQGFKNGLALVVDKTGAKYINNLGKEIFKFDI